MPDIVLDLLKFLLLGVLYIFIARVVRAIALELKPGREEAPVRSTASSPKRTKKVPTKVAVIEGALKGKSFDLGDELVIGRGEKCRVVLDDTYVSTVHARVFPKGNTYAVEDLGSTNGTYLNRRRITAPTEVHRGDQIKIGKTVLELRR
ncbi:MAG TPA: FHA domain-containing protein [Actinomycetota bacterium]|nr:FHA domain-containing protein [Actinomycetota bacterium]